ncbi:MAG: sigma 54-interacting transcriptional regulator [bacterium]|nr:sigma 54-interacting transcriptional regulator [bacterium]
MASLAFSHCGEYAKGRELIESAIRLLAQHKRELGVCYENLTVIEIKSGRFREARKAVATGLQIANELAPESALFTGIKTRQAELAVATGKFTEAQKHAAEALAVAEKIGQRLEIAACWRVFAQVAAATGKAEEARDWFRRSIDLFNQISARYELAVARYAAASSEIFERSESVALLYLAKEYCEAEQVAPYLAKIDAALAKLEPRKIALQPSDSDTVKIITRSKRMLSLLDLARHVAPTRMTVLLTGATGTGKDLMARWIHEQSGRTGRFLSQNFAALPGPLAESELFGHRKGTFTGASDDKPGLFEAAAGGTFYLNEIAEAPLELQAKLLEVLETRSLRRLGETTDRSVDIRIIAATNHDLAKAVRENRFRADLYHRLNEINIALPPLAERTEDIPDLIAHFVKELGVSATNGSAAYLERLSSIVSAHSWPGNIRELRTFVRKLLVIAENDISKLPEIAQDQLPMTDESQLVRILEQSDWNQTRAAETLGVSEGTIRKRIRKFGLDRD